MASLKTRVNRLLANMVSLRDAAEEEGRDELAQTIDTARESIGEEYAGLWHQQPSAELD